MSKHGDDETWIQTFTGKQFWPLDPHAEDVDIRDIAHALSLKCRYTGHCRYLYTVGQHSLHVAKIVMNSRPTFGLTALLHDAAEAYTADIARPVKKFIQQFGEIEHRLEQVIAERFGLLFPFPEEVKHADNIMLATERRDLMPNPPRPWKTYGAEPLPWHISTMTCRKVEQDFLDLFAELARPT